MMRWVGVDGERYFDEATQRVVKIVKERPVKAVHEERHGVAFTAERLIQVLRRVPPSTHVLVATPGWYENLQDVIWDPDQGIFGVTLFPCDDFDTRRF